MTKRLATSVLWCYAGWTLGAFLAFATGTSQLAGPLVGLAAGLIVGVDPRGAIWRRTQRQGWSAA